MNWREKAKDSAEIVKQEQHPIRVAFVAQELVAQELLRALALLERCAEELKNQEYLWRNLPSGIDEDADENDGSPEDGTAHMGGLAVRQIQKLLADLNAEE